MPNFSTIYFFTLSARLSESPWLYAFPPTMSAWPSIVILVLGYFFMWAATLAISSWYFGLTSVLSKSNSANSATVSFPCFIAGFGGGSPGFLEQRASALRAASFAAAIPSSVRQDR
ncbi:MAG: hypothetical protein HW377_2808 [Actinobacteria bacterium]|nr:hypothetical protein [Actinomycetota bacterium]